MKERGVRVRVRVWFTTRVRFRVRVGVRVWPLFFVIILLGTFLYP